jgi:membrane-bound ClpP family serine protease
LFWVHQKDRYLRQLLIRDIEAETGRDLIVYFTDCSTSAQVDPGDDAYIAELLSGVTKPGVDLFLETNGGYTDATEKICAMLLSMTTDLRVIVPRKAKSNGTVIAFTGSAIVMGPLSELGPIDPNLTLGPNNSVPAELIVRAAIAAPGSQQPLIVQYAELAIQQTKKLATTVLSARLLKGQTPQQIEEVVAKVASRDHYHSHGSVIDYQEAKALGLKVTNLARDDDLWNRLWLLRTMYEHDCRSHRLAKLFESARISSGIALAPSAP